MFERIKVFLYRRFFTSWAGLTLGDWLCLLLENKFRIAPRYWPRAIFVTLCAPLNSLQKPFENARCDRSAHVPPPIFILGHWRSGTTYLHQLLSLDKRFVSPTMVEVLFPHAVLTGGPMGFFMGLFLPATRGVDQVKLGVDEPFEDEFALALLTRLSPYLGWAFPSERARHESRLYLDDPAEAARWSREFNFWLTKLSQKHAKPALLKSPPHTARIRHLVKLFPDARFIHIHRDPVTVFSSTCRLLASGIDGLRLQKSRVTSVEEEVIDRYRRLYSRYLEDRHLVPAGRLVEISYAQLVQSPLDVLSQVYNQLELPSFEVSQPAFERFLEQSKSYASAAQTPLERDTRARLKREWSTIYTKFGYDIEV